jgi:hypothetical protein
MLGESTVFDLECSHDSDTPPIRVAAYTGSREIAFEADGYGVCGMDDNTELGKIYRPIVVIEQVEGRLCCFVWADINQEDPTHTIELAGAKVSNRKDQACL